ncbi:PAS domain-containing protein [Planktothricoides sp. FACHB-1370]|uniref:PAS domain-containing protein n=2 Tax=Planktothricoides raciborskii TaxID=132608 RepID=A0ABR8E8M6_9CYAN|nr:PAS domain-containing protein [Planktothricoides raciborskii FACHB-1370]MBD2581947.1 PAS domain-containing protein [Planktothricoides raciborskii FACHB-1261]
MSFPTSANPMLHNSVKVPLRLMLIIPFALQILVAVGLTAGLSWYNGKKAVNDLSSQLMTEVAAQVKQRVNQLGNPPDRVLTPSEIGNLLQSLNINQFKQIAIVERSGKIVVRRESNLPLIPNSEAPESIKTMPNGDELIQSAMQFLQLDRQDWAEIDQSQRYRFTFNGQSYVFHVTPIAQGPELDWLLFILIPESALMAPINADLGKAILIGIGALGLTSLTALTITEFMRQRIRQLREAAQEIAQGKTGQTIDRITVDRIMVKELAILAHSLDEMMQEMQQSAEKSAVYTQELQQQLEAKTEQLEREIRDRHIVEQQLQTSERKMRAFFAAMTDLILVLDTDGNFEIAPTNPAALYSPDIDIIGLTIEHFCLEENFQWLQDKIQRVLETQETLNFDYRLTVDTEAKWFTARVSPMSENSVIWVARDISDRKEAELALHLAQQQSESLLLNILPKTIAEQLKQSTDAIAEHFDEVSILFSDIVGFTPLSARLSPIDLVKLLNEMFSKFDKLAEKYQLEKIKTIGDAYMVAAGLPVQRKNHAQAIAEMALDMQGSIQQFSLENREEFQIRIGIHSGPVVAGVIGKKKFSYDLWGDTVNVASRMESSGIPGKIQITGDTYELLKDRYVVEKRGQIFVKGKGDMITYWLIDRKADKLSGEKSQITQNSHPA